MAVTVAKILARKRLSNTREGMYAVCLFLTNELDGETGPAWTVVECDDTSTRAVPAGGTFANAGNNWVSGSGPPAAGSWCVLETRDANNEFHMQLYVQLETDANADFKVIPFEDFATGGASTGGSDPTFPATSFGAGSSVVNFNAFSTSGWFNCVADEGMMSLLAVNDMDTSPRWIYAGECDAFHSGTGDDRCYVIWDTPTTITVGNNAGPFNRLSPADNSTILTQGYFSHPAVGLTDFLSYERDRGNLFGSDVIWPVAIFFQDGGHVHDVGWLRNVFTSNFQMGNEGTMGTSGNPDFYFFNNNTFGTIVFPWDGTTRI